MTPLSHRKVVDCFSDIQYTVNREDYRFHKNKRESIMTNCLPNNIFGELFSKLRAAGLPEGQAQTFAERCCGYRDYNPAYFELFRNQQMPSDDCFRTLAEAQVIFASKTDSGNDSQELDFIDRYLNVPYSDVVEVKKEIARSFDVDDSSVEAVYAQDPEWLLITADSVKAFSDFLHSQFRDPDLMWSIYKEAALLGLEKTQYRIDNVLDLLGAKIGEMVIRKDLQGEAWLFYRWFPDPVGCIRYMLECGLAPDKIQIILQQEPRLLYVYKETRAWEHKYLPEVVDSMMHFMDSTIQKYLNQSKKSESVSLIQSENVSD